MSKEVTETKAKAEFYDFPEAWAWIRSRIENNPEPPSAISVNQVTFGGNNTWFVALTWRSVS